MDLIVSSHVVVHDAPTADKSESDEDILKRLDDIEQRKASTIGTVKHLTERINAMFKDLNVWCKDIQADIAELSREAAELKDEIQKKTIAEAPPFVPDELDKEFEKVEEEFFDGGFESYSFNDNENNAPEESPEIKKMFQRIAMKCHPDRTDDPELHLLFLSAKECRNNNDLEGLTEIFNFVIGKSSRLLTKLMKKLQSAMEELSMLELNLERLRHSMDYTLLNLYDKDQQQVRNMSRQQMHDKRIRLLAQVEMLRSLLGREIRVKSSLFEF